MYKGVVIFGVFKIIRQVVYPDRGMEYLFNGPITEGDSYNRLVSKYYNVIESELDEYRARMAE